MRGRRAPGFYPRHGFIYIKTVQRCLRGNSVSDTNPFSGTGSSFFNSKKLFSNFNRAFVNFQLEDMFFS